MTRLINSELANVHFTYGFAVENALMARRIYQQQYPKRINTDA